MLVSPSDAAHFMYLHASLMAYANAQLGTFPGVATASQFTTLEPEDRVAVRDGLLDRPELIPRFVEENPLRLSAEDLEIVDSWRHFVVGNFFVHSFLKKHAIFMSSDSPPVAYGVLGLTERLDEVAPVRLPMWVRTLLLPFRGQIVYDGHIEFRNITFGSGVRASLNDDYREAKARQGVVTTLPPGSAPPRQKKPAPKRAKGKHAAAPGDAAKEVAANVIELVNRFCLTHLNPEYATLCRELAEKLARKRPSPLSRGNPQTWACGIVRTIGWVNFLSDSSQKPHMKLTAIDKAFGVAESTGQGKSMEIRKMFRIRQFDHHWQLAERTENSTMTWLLQVNGLLMDIRDCPRDAQVVAFEKGLIPYIPDDQ